ncbi:MAG: YqgE/AlgH family protein [Ferruginibacter sp.]
MIDPRQDILLIADPFLKDPNFMRTVVYICRLSEEGCFGFVLNKLFEQNLGELITDLENFEIPVFTGGPVQPDTVHYIHQYPELIPGSYKISDEIHWGGDFEIVKELIRENRIDLSKIKFFIGYSGWDKDQLENEMKEKSWLTATSTRKIVFDTSPENVWKESIEHLGGKYKMMINFPIDPQLN